MNIELSLDEIKMINQALSYSMYDITSEDIYDNYDKLLFKLREIEYEAEEN